MKRILIAAAAILFFTGSGAAMAQIQSTSMNVGRAYVGVSGGIAIPQNIHETISGADTGSLTLNFNSGPAATVFGGYHITDWFAAEGELGFATFDEKSISGTLDGAAVSTGVNATVDTFVGFANAVFTPLGHSRFSPYVGAGAGFASFTEKVASVGGVNVGSSTSATRVAADALVGFDVGLSDRWTLGARYRFIWAASGGTTVSGADSIKEDDLLIHVFTVNGTYRF